MHHRTCRLALLLCAVASAAVAQDHWVASWSSSPIQRVEKTPDTPEQTLREIIRTSIGGSQVRLTLSNRLGAEPLAVSGANLALSLGGSAIDPASLHPITFAGKPSAILPPGTTLQSDPVAMPVPPRTELAVTLWLPAQTISRTTEHPVTSQTNYRAPGNHLTGATLVPATEELPRLFLTSLDVLAPANAAAIVTLGDSITDGFASTVNSNHRYPDFLVDRLQADPNLSLLGVANTGISGNRVLHDIVGPAAIHRFDTDVLALSGAKYIVLLEGINDVGFSMHPATPADHVNASQIIAGLTQLIDRAHAHGLKIYGATLLPFLAIKDQTAEDESTRAAVNRFIRTGGKFDAVIDFEEVIADPAEPRQFKAEFDCGDHVHPNDLGYKAMADAIDLALFTK